MMKRQYEWLNKVDKFALTNAIFDLDTAYNKFFIEHAGYPKFKRKHDSKKSYSTNMINNYIEVSFDEGRIKPPYLKHVKAKLHRKFTEKIKRATVSLTPTGKYYMSTLIETGHDELFAYR